MGKGMKITGVATGLVVLAALVSAPLVRHRIGWADAQTRPAHGIDPGIVAPIEIGMNTGAVSYYTSEEPFADPFKAHGQLSLQPGPSPISEDQLKHDDQGNLIDVPVGTKFMVRLKDGAAPITPGTYRCQISPGWRVENFLNAPLTQSGTKFTVTLPKQAPTTIAINLYAEKNGVSLTKLACNAPGESPDALFSKAYLEDMRPYRIIRFMDWMVTNNAPKRIWAKRPTPQSIDQITSGVALEYMVALANTLHADPWFTVPLDTDADYYRNFALYVRDHLDPGLKAYVELSNETWNDGFQQGRDTTARGKKAYPGVSDDKANDYYYADRVRDLMAIWSDVFKGQEKRIVRVLGSQMWDQRGDQRLGHKETYKFVDALAIAPYWGDVPTDVPFTGKQRVDAVIARTPGYIDQAIGAGHANKLVAAKYGLPLITYEGGPGFYAFEPVMVKDVKAISHDPRLYPLYQGFLRRWQKEIGGPLVLFEGTGEGMFAHKDYTGQPLSDAVKARAVADFVQGLPAAQQPRSTAAAAP